MSRGSSDPKWEIDGLGIMRCGLMEAQVTEPAPVGGGAAACVAAAFLHNGDSIVALGARHSAISDPPATAAGSVLHVSGVGEVVPLFRFATWWARSPRSKRGTWGARQSAPVQTRR